MGVYKVIFRDDHLAWDEKCPIGMAAVQVARNTQTGECFLQTKLRNISGAQCSAIEFIVRLYSGDGRSEEVEFRLLDADLPAGHVFTPEAKKIELTEIAGADATVTRVDDVRSFGPKVEVPKPKALKPDERLLGERKILLQNKGVDWAVCTGAHQTHDSWWVCGCGAVNYRRNSCWYCYASLELLGKVDSPEYLEESACQRTYDFAEAQLSSKKQADVAAAVEAFKSLAKKGFKDADEKLKVATTRLEEVKAADAAAKKRAKKFIAVGAAAAVVIACGVGISTVIKAQQQKQEMYEQAEAALEAGKTSDALRLYESAGDYKDAEAKAEEVKESLTPEATLYERAVKELGTGDLTAAIKHLESLGDYKDAASKLDEAKEKLYQKANKYYDEGEYALAKDMFATLGDYADAVQRAQEAESLAK